MRARLIAVLGASALLVACSSGGNDANENGIKLGAGGNASASNATSTSIGGSGGGFGGDDGMPSDVYPAPHPPFPQVVNLGASVLASPKIYPVFFMNDDPTFIPPLSDFVAKLGATAYWATTTAEYGVGPATGEPPIMSSETPTGSIDDATVEAWLAAKFNSNDSDFPIPDANTLMVIFYPTEVTLMLGTEVACKSFGSYHTSTKLDAAHGNLDIPFAAIQRCGDFLPGLTGVPESTVFASHEILEAVTDPRPQDTPAFGTVDLADFAWTLGIGGGEVADLCSGVDGAITTFPPSLYTVTEAYSNKAAKAGGNPCVPKAAGQLYYNAGLVLPDMVSIAYDSVTVTTKGVKIPVGQSRTLEVDVFSDGPTGSLRISANDLSPYEGGPKLLDFAFDRTQALNGEKVHVTITALQAFPASGALFLLYAELPTGKFNIWPGLATN